MDAWDSLDDQGLVAYARDGFPDAYGVLVVRYQGRVFAAVYRLVGERQEALDVTQEAFVRGFAALGSFDVGRAFGPWIVRIAVNVALNGLARRRVPTVSFGGVLGETGVVWQPCDVSMEPEQVLLAREQRALVHAAILGLPAHYRAVIELRHFQELSYDEIAEALGLSVSDVRSHLFRARRLLRDRLAGSL